MVGVSANQPQGESPVDKQVLNLSVDVCARSLWGNLERGTVASNWKQMTRVHLLCRKKW